MNGREKSGFTLLEVMIVLVILLTGLVALSQLLSASLRQSVEAEEKTSIQMICQNRLGRFLSGEETIPRGVNEPIAGFNDWFMTVHLEDGPVEGLSRIRIVAEKQERIEESSGERPGAITFSYLPVAGQRVVLAQWVRSASVKVERGAAAAVGSLRGVPGDPFSAGGFAPSSTGVFLPGEDAQTAGGRRSRRRARTAGEVDGGSVKIGGDPVSESLLERARERMENAE